MCGSVFPSGRFSDSGRARGLPRGSVLNSPTRSFHLCQRARRQSTMGVAGAWRLPVSASNLPPEAPSAAGNALSALSWRLRVPAPSRNVALEMERRCSPLLFSSLLFSPLTFSCPRAPFSAPGQHHPAGALQGSRRAGLMVRLLTGDPGSSPEAAFSEIPLCPGGGSREKETREAPWLLVSRWLRISRGRELSCEPSPSLLIFRLTSFSASSGGSGSRQGQRSVCRPC